MSASSINNIAFIFVHLFFFIIINKFKQDKASFHQLFVSFLTKFSSKILEKKKQLKLER
jgi:hypothetical protein